MKRRTFVIAIVELGESWGTRKEIAKMTPEEAAALVRLCPSEFTSEAAFYVSDMPPEEVKDALTRKAVASWLGPVVTPTPDPAKPFSPEAVAEDATEAHAAYGEHFRGKP